MKETTQPEEWIVRFREQFHNYPLDEPRHVLIEQSSGILEDFIKTEIRKAEEKSYNQAITDAVGVVGENEEGKTLFEIGSEFATPRDYKRNERNYLKEEIRASLEALKK